MILYSSLPSPFLSEEPCAVLFLPLPSLSLSGDSPLVFALRERKKTMSAIKLRTFNAYHTQALAVRYYVYILTLQDIIHPPPQDSYPMMYM